MIYYFLYFGQVEPLPDELCDLVSLTSTQGDLGKPDLRVEAPQYFAASTIVTTAHVEPVNTKNCFLGNERRRT